MQWRKRCLGSHPHSQKPQPFDWAIDSGMLGVAFCRKSSVFQRSGWWISWLVGWLVGWLAGWLVGWLVGRSVDWFVGWFVGWLGGWLAGWLVDCSVACLVNAWREGKQERNPPFEGSASHFLLTHVSCSDTESGPFGWLMETYVDGMPENTPMEPLAPAPFGPGN